MKRRRALNPQRGRGFETLDPEFQWQSAAVKSLSLPWRRVRVEQWNSHPEVDETVSHLAN